jgi:hypothetical protein
MDPRAGKDVLENREILEKKGNSARIRFPEVRDRSVVCIPTTL